jgi:hypothetical protein
MQYGDFAGLMQGKISWISVDGERIKPSYSDHYIAGVKYDAGLILLDAELYFRNNRNVPETVQQWELDEKKTASNLIRQNDSKSYGLDVLLKKDSGIFQGWISYGYCRTFSKYLKNGKVHESPASNDTPHKINAAASLHLHGFTFSAVWSYISGRPYTIPCVTAKDIDGTISSEFTEPVEYNGSRFAASHQLDLTAEYAFMIAGVKTEAGVSVFNVYNRKNIWCRLINIKNNKLIQEDISMLGITPSFFVDIRL